MPSLEGLRLKVRNKYIERTVKYRKNKIKNEDFTIISNNCWAGFIYQSYGIPYNTPTIGLYFMAEDYLKFVKDIKKYLKLNLEFISPNNSKYVETLKKEKSFGSYPIARLGDIEIIFLHYKTPEEAKEKWERRCLRINWNKIIYKFNDQNGCTIEHLKKFDELKLQNKISFTSKAYEEVKSAIFIKSAKKQNVVFASQEPFGNSKYLNINKLINKL